MSTNAPRRPSVFHSSVAAFYGHSLPYRFPADGFLAVGGTPCRVTLSTMLPCCQEEPERPLSMVAAEDSNTPTGNAAESSSRHVALLIPRSN